jgi:Ni/Fe-hydrogenase subunit HybB-like protein
MESDRNQPFNRWQRGVHVFDVPVFTGAFVAMLVISFVGLVLTVVRMFGGLAFTGMTDSYAWGVWKTFNVMTLTALGSGGFAVGIAAWLFDQKKLHLVMRTALLMSLVFYFSGLIALAVDVGRPWNMYLLFLPHTWNLHSSLLEVAVCMTAYAVIFLSFENIPPLFERVYVNASTFNRRHMLMLKPAMKAVYPFMVAAAYVLPIMHQSSLGSLLLLGGQKIHPLWQTQALPLLYVIQAGVAGTACLLFTLMVGSMLWRRPIDVDVLSSLAKLMAGISASFWAIRVVDLWANGKLGLAFEPTVFVFLFHLENILLVVPALLMWFVSSNRRRPRMLFLCSWSTMVGSMLYRFVPTTITFVPGELKVYFPSVVELIMSVSYIALTIAIFSWAVKVFAIFPGPLDAWYRVVAYSRDKLNLKVDIHGKPTHD